MKLTVAQLRRIIREALEEQGWVPGRWMPGTGEPVDREDLERLGNHGFLDGLDETDGVEEGHEDDAENYQMDHQGDGFMYDQMGKKRKKP